LSGIVVLTEPGDWPLDGDLYTVISHLESSVSPTDKAEISPPVGGLKVGILAVGSMLVGGLIAAWWYRKTLLKLRKSEGGAQNPHFGIPGDGRTDG
jgi:hypothetical protein